MKLVLCRTWSIFFLGLMSVLNTLSCRQANDHSRGMEMDSSQQTSATWDRDALEAQPRLDEYAAQIPADLKHEPASTAWRTTDVMEDQLGADTPGLLLHAFIGANDLSRRIGESVWEQTCRVLHENHASAIGVILHWGHQDDSVAGEYWRITMRRGNAEWVIESVEERTHCRRGIADGGLCL